MFQKSRQEPQGMSKGNVVGLSFGVAIVASVVTMALTKILSKDNETQFLPDFDDDDDEDDEAELTPAIFNGRYALRYDEGTPVCDLLDFTKEK